MRLYAEGSHVPYRLADGITGRDPPPGRPAAVPS
jgi:hypothetical protein